MPALARSASKDAVNCPPRSRTRNRKSSARSPRSISRLRICCVVHGSSGSRSRRGYAHTGSRPRSRRSSTGAARSPRSPRGRSRPQALSRLARAGTSATSYRWAAPAPGEIFSALRTRRIVDALTPWPNLSSSPWILLYPQPWFSAASRSMSAATSALAGGRLARPVLYLEVFGLDPMRPHQRRWRRSCSCGYSSGRAASRRRPSAAGRRMRTWSGHAERREQPGWTARCRGRRRADLSPGG